MNYVEFNNDHLPRSYQPLKYRGRSVVAHCKLSGNYRLYLRRINMSVSRNEHATDAADPDG